MDGGVDFRLKKAVAAVKSQNGLHVNNKQRLAEDAVYQQAAGRLDMHAFAQIVAPKIMVALQDQVGKFLARLLVDLENHFRASVSCPALGECHLRIEVAL